MGYPEMNCKSEKGKYDINVVLQFAINSTARSNVLEGLEI
jgi:hypothetical protein